MCLEYSSHEIHKKEKESKSDPTKEVTYFSVQLYIPSRKKPCAIIQHMQNTKKSYKISSNLNHIMYDFLPQSQKD